jgi:hypothetical protein
MSLEHARAGQLEDRRHPRRHARDGLQLLGALALGGADLPGPLEALRAHAARVAELSTEREVPAEHVEADGNPGLGKEAPERLVDVESVGLPGHDAGEEDRGEAAFDAAGRLRDRLRDVVEGDHPGRLEAHRLGGEDVGHEVVVGRRESHRVLGRGCPTTAIQADVGKHHLCADVLTRHVSHAPVQIRAVRRVRAELALLVPIRECDDGTFAAEGEALALDLDVEVADGVRNEQGNVAAQRLGEPSPQVRRLADVCVRTDQHIRARCSAHVSSSRPRPRRGPDGESS